MFSQPQVEQLNLKDHFNVLYQILSDTKLIPDAHYEEIDYGLKRCLSGIPVPYHNAILGLPTSDGSIEKQLAFFRKANMPFVWYLDEQAPQEAKQKLLDHGFVDGGILRGVMASLEKLPPAPPLPKGCSLELVTSEQALDAFNEIVGAAFEFDELSKQLFKKVLQKGMYHWMARYEGRPVSVLSTLIERDMVSYWNSATLPEYRRQGYTSSLLHFALCDAISKGCRLGSSYLMSDGMAFGLLTRLGYQSKWHFHAFLAK